MFWRKIRLLSTLWLCLKAGLPCTPHFFIEAIVRWLFDSSFVKPLFPQNYGGWAGNKPSYTQQTVSKNHFSSCMLSHFSCIFLFDTLMTAGSELRLWQRSWGRRLGIRKGGIKPQESPWKFSSNLPPNPESAYFLLCAFTYTSDFTGGCPPRPLWKKS